MDSSSVLVAIEYVGIVAFAVSAAVLAAHKGMDIVGIVVLAVIVSLAGGSLRDIVLGALPVFWVTDPTFALVGALAALAAIPLSRLGALSVMQRYNLVRLADAAGLAVFTVVGTATAIAFGANEVAAIIVGIIAGLGGGMIRDTLLDQIPAVLGSGRLYASAAISGAVMYVLLLRLGVDDFWTLWISVGVALGIRAFAIVSGWRIPTVDLGDGHGSHDSADT